MGCAAGPGAAVRGTALALALLAGGGASAGEWRVTPRLELGATYTDNVTLAPRGDATSDTVAQVNPGFTLHGDGARVKADLDYRMQNLAYAHDSARNRTRHQLTGSGSVALVPRLFSLEGAARVGQRFANPTGRVALDTLADSANLVDVTALSLSPHYHQNYRALWVADVRYDLGKVQYGGGNVPDGTSRQWHAGLASGPRFERLPWRISYRRIDVDYAGATNAPRLESGEGSLRLHLDRQFALLAQAGYEDNNFATAPGAAAPRGGYWAAGFAWLPGRRTRLDATWGHRFFGSYGTAELRHHSRRTRWQLDYLEDLATSQQVELAGRGAGGACRASVTTPLVPDAGSGAVPVIAAAPLGAFSLLDQDLFPVRSGEVFVRRCGQAAAALDLGRSTLTAGVFRETRDFQPSASRDQARGASLSWIWNAPGRTSVALHTGRQVSEFSLGGVQNTFLFEGIAVTRRIRPELDGVLRYRHSSLDSNVAGGDYRENILSLEATLRF